MKVIDILNKIANGELKDNTKFKIINEDHTFICRYDASDPGEIWVVDNNDNFEFNYTIDHMRILNYEVEIIPIQEEIVEYTNKFLEVWKPINKQFGKLFDELLRIKNDLGLNLEDEIEEKEIPEKLEMLNANDHTKEVYYENYSKEEIALDIETLQIWINKLIDYLKSKGDE